MDIILNLVTDYYDISESDLKNNNPRRELVMYRAVLITLLNNLTSCTSGIIAQYLGLSTSAISVSLGRVKNKKVYNTVFINIDLDIQYLSDFYYKKVNERKYKEVEELNKNIKDKYNELIEYNNKKIKEIEKCIKKYQSLINEDKL